MPEPLTPTEFYDGVFDLDQVIRRAASLWPERRAWHTELDGQSLTFRDINERTWALGEALLREGPLRQGDVVAVMADNTVEFPLAWLALVRRGLTMVPLNPRYGSHDIAHVLANAGVSAIAATAPYVERIEGLERAPGVSVLNLSLLAQHESSGAVPGRGTDTPLLEPANIQFTSGTTGKPKGCVLGHEYWLHISHTLSEEFPYLNDTDVVLTAQPFYYIDPQWNVSTCLYSGAELIILDGFHPSTFWDRVRHYNVTYFYCLGLMPSLLLAMPATPKDSEHRVRAIEASGIPPSLHADLESRWGVPWLEAFGMTETGADIYVTPDMHAELVGSGCLGIPRPHRQVSIRDSNGHECPPGVIGELFLRGPGMMREYFGDPVATAAAFSGGWFATGDLVEKTSGGALYHRGRSKDMIRRSGENIAAAEVEDVVSSFPEVTTVAILGVADELRGEEVLALVVPKDTSILDNPDALAALTRELRSRCEERLAVFKVPRYWRWVSDLPRSASERVLKKEIDLELHLELSLDTSSTLKPRK